MVVERNVLNSFEVTLKNNPSSGSDDEIHPSMICGSKSIDLEYSLKHGRIVFVEDNVETMFTEDKLIDNSICTLHEMITYLFHQLCFLPNKFLSAIPKQSSDEKKKSSLSDVFLFKFHESHFFRWNITR